MKWRRQESLFLQDEREVNGGGTLNQNAADKQRLAKPPWLKRRIPSGATYQEIRGLIQKTQLHTVCQEACCPNLGECFSQGTATFLILGDRCTRNCRFCAVAHGPTEPPDPGEPLRVAEAVDHMKLTYAVVTSVTRDDLEDGGAAAFAQTIRRIRDKRPETKVEVLVPDFHGNPVSLKIVLEARPDVLNHNLESVPRLYASVRPGAVYQRSIDLLKSARQIDPSIPTKSGLMLGLGEQPEEVKQVLKDLLEAGCRILTLGQYLQPSARHLPVDRFVTPEEFEDWREKALELGFQEVASGPFVRSSYHAQEIFERRNRQMGPQEMPEQGYKIIARVVSQKGTCGFGYKVGDEVVFDAETIKGRICISALYSFLPKVYAMRYGVIFPWLKENKDVASHACPDAANPVVFEICRVKE